MDRSPPTREAMVIKEHALEAGGGQPTPKNRSPRSLTRDGHDRVVPPGVPVHVGRRLRGGDAGRRSRCPLHPARAGFPRDRASPGRGRPPGRRATGRTDTRRRHLSGQNRSEWREQRVHGVQAPAP